MADEASHHVYIIECNDGTLYTGYVLDVNKEYAHNAGHKNTPEGGLCDYFIQKSMMTRVLLTT